MLKPEEKSHSEQLFGALSLEESSSYHFAGRYNKEQIRRRFYRWKFEDSSLEDAAKQPSE
jgi:hypothetical protein